MERKFHPGVVVVEREISKGLSNGLHTLEIAEKLEMPCLW